MFLKSFSERPETNLAHQFIAEMALDYVDAELNKPNLPSSCSLLVVHNGIAVYGYLTNTNVKLFIGTDAWTEQMDLAPTMKELQELYISHVCNPFYNAKETRIASPSFSAKVDKIVDQALKQHAGLPANVMSY